MMNSLEMCKYLTISCSLIAVVALYILVGTSYPTSQTNHNEPDYTNITDTINNFRRTWSWFSYNPLRLTLESNMDSDYVLDIIRNNKYYSECRCYVIGSEITCGGGYYC